MTDARAFRSFRFPVSYRDLELMLADLVEGGLQQVDPDREVALLGQAPQALAAECQRLAPAAGEQQAGEPRDGRPRFARRAH